jgi:N-acetyl-gamma-glutamyl-phosphate reductase
MAQASKSKIFIDGEAGTTGLQIRDRLAHDESVEVLSIEPELRKDVARRQELMAAADVTILCLPDDAAREAVKIADALGGKAPRIIDASTAHRTAEDWVYGFAELAGGQAERIARAPRVSNPGCYPTGAIAVLRPLVDAGLMSPDHGVTINAVSGYTGGGRTMIEAHEGGTAPVFELYGLDMRHKHIPELMRYAGLKKRPIFVPSVGSFAQGMLVSIPLHLEDLPGKPCLRDVEHAIETHYAGLETVRVITKPTQRLGTRIGIEDLNGTDRLELFVFGNAQENQAVLVARLDNLGKGAAGAALQNLKLMLGNKP